MLRPLFAAALASALAYAAVFLLPSTTSTALAVDAAETPTSASAPIAVAVFPFEINVERQMGMGFGASAGSEAEQKRLVKAQARLIELLNGSDRFEVVSLNTLGQKLTDAQPIYKCNGCDTDLAKLVRADRSVTGLVQKASANLLNITIIIKDTATGDVLQSMAVSVRQNTDEAWLRGVRWLVRNRILKS